MSRGHILVVDDNEHNRLLVRAILESSGYAVSEAEDGGDAVARFVAGPCDLILLDIMMPNIDGLTACRTLRQQPRGAEVPIVFLTALHDPETHEHALLAGADDFLGKPINRVELLIRVRSLLRVSRLQEELRRERDALVRLHEQKELLGALLVHDLKNPLASIIANGQYVLSGPELSPDSRDAVRDVLDSAQAMHQMVMNLLDISRAEDGALVPACVTVVAHELLEQVRRHTERRVVAAGQRLVIVDETVGHVSVDPVLIKRVLENLLDNSIKYAPSGSTITVEARTTERDLEIVVRDEGAGVPHDRREKIFEKYVQGEQAEAHRSGRGLGLVFCRLALEAHRGSLRVEDNAPRGAAFWLQVPRVDQGGGTVDEGPRGVGSGVCSGESSGERR